VRTHTNTHKHTHKHTHTRLHLDSLYTHTHTHTYDHKHYCSCNAPTHTHIYTHIYSWAHTAAIYIHAHLVRFVSRSACIDSASYTFTPHALNSPPHPHRRSFLGLTVGAVQGGSSPEACRSAFACHVTYVTGQELCFNYLRDNTAQEPTELVSRDMGIKGS
jgi:SecA DEAD-like domain